MQGPMPGARRRGRPRTAWMVKIKRWTGLPVEESVRMTEDRDKRRKYVHVVANRRIEWSRTAEEVKNRTEQNVSMSQMLQTDARDGQMHSLCCSCSARRSSVEPRVSRVWDKAPARTNLFVLEVPEFLYNTARSVIRLDWIPICNRQTDTEPQLMQH